MRLAAMSAAKQCPCVQSLIYSRYWTSTRSWLRSWLESSAHRANIQEGARNDTRPISNPVRYGKSWSPFGLMEKQIVSKQRVSDHGEVYTRKREVSAMLDLVKQETERI